MEKPIGNIGNVEERLDELFEIYGKLARRLDDLFNAAKNDLSNLEYRIRRLERR